jgi:hypothetical protein
MQTGGKSGLQVLRLHGLGTTGDAPDNVRGLVFAMRASAGQGAATESATENIPPVGFDLGGRLAEKPRAGLFRTKRIW